MRSGEGFDTLRARYADDDAPAGPVVTASLSAVLQGAADPLGVVGYLTGLGLPVAKLDDLLGINALADEEELSAHPVAEGIALSIASDNAWVLFRP